RYQRRVVGWEIGGCYRRNQVGTQGSAVVDRLHGVVMVVVVAGHSGVAVGVHAQRRIMVGVVAPGFQPQRSGAAGRETGLRRQIAVRIVAEGRVVAVAVGRGLDLILIVVGRVGPTHRVARRID